MTQVQASKDGRAAAGALDLEEKLLFLRTPEAYPEHPSTVVVQETHFSLVFLFPEVVYKLKKPSIYSFADFSTITARRRSCLREVRLNRRLADGVYIGVVPLNADADGQLSLGGPGKPVDWLVKMKRLPADRTLEHLILTQAVRRRDVDAVVAKLAQHYKTATPIYRNPDRYVHSFRATIRQDRDQLLSRKYALPADQVKAVADCLLNFLKHHGDLARARAATGRIVEGHGDLRPQHVYLCEEPQIIDCLEFSRRLRMLDPVDDLAYLVMECEWLGERRIDKWCFDAYAHQTGERPNSSLTVFYKCRHAFRRAVIVIWHLDDPKIGSDAKWRRKAMSYLDLARRYAASIS